MVAWASPLSNKHYRKECTNPTVHLIGSMCISSHQCWKHRHFILQEAVVDHPIAIWMIHNSRHLRNQTRKGWYRMGRAPMNWGTIQGVGGQGPTCKSSLHTSTPSSILGLPGWRDEVKQWGRIPRGRDFPAVLGKTIVDSGICGRWWTVSPPHSWIVPKYAP